MPGLAGTAMASVVGAALSAACAIATIPLLTRFLTPADYALCSLFLSGIGLLVPFISLNGAAQVSLVGAEGDQTRTDRATAAALVVIGCVAALLLIAGITAALLVESLTGLPAWLLPLLVLASAGQAVIALRIARSQAELHAWSAALQSVVIAAATLVMTVVAVAVLNAGAIGRIVALVAVTGGAGFILAIAWRHLAPPAATDLRALLAVGLPLIPHALAGWTLAVADRYAVAGSLGLAEAGVYVLAAQCVQLLAVIEDGAARAWSAWALRTLALGHDGATRVRSAAWIAAIAMPPLLALFVVVVPHLILVLAGPDWMPAAGILAWLTVAQGCSMCYKLVVVQLYHARRTDLVAWSSVVGAAAGIAALMVLVPLWGAHGAAVAAFCGQGAILLLVLISMRRLTMAKDLP